MSLAIMYTAYMSGVLTHIIFDMDASLNKRISSSSIEEEYTDTVAERIDRRVRFISSLDTESLRIGW